MEGRITELERGRWRLLWTGNCRYLQETPPYWYVDAIFIKQWSGGHRIRRLTRPIAELPLLAPMSQWKNGCCIGYSNSAHPIQQLDVYPEPIGTLFESHGIFPEINRKDYNFFGEKWLAGCWKFSTTTHIDLIVPCWQILQAWYFFHPAITTAIISGHLAVDGTPALGQPWLPGTGIDGERVTYHLPNHLNIETAVRFSRILFDPIANRQAKLFRAKLLDLVSKNRTLSPLPFIRPPTNKISRWSFRGIPISSLNGRDRILVLHLNSALIPLPFRTFEPITNDLADTSQNDNFSNAGSASAASANTARPLPLSRFRSASSSSSGHPLEGLTFQDKGADNIEIQDIKTQPYSLRDQVARHSASLSLESDCITTISGGDSDLNAIAANGFVNARDAERGNKDEAGTQKPPEDPRILFKRTENAFLEIVEFVGRMPENYAWSAHFVNSNNRATENYFRSGPREFLILSLQIAGRFAYAVDALRLNSDGEYPLVLVRTWDYRELTGEVFHQKLQEFPGHPRRRWSTFTEENGFPGTSRPFPHQTTDLPTTIPVLPGTKALGLKEAYIVRLFRNRLIRHFARFLNATILSEVTDSQESEFRPQPAPKSAH
ncbi:MAG: hypothetical protein AB7E72_03420 [Lysobacterales bacterium]